MASTARNMLKILYDRKCGAVVMLSDLVENGEVRCFQNIQTFEFKFEAENDQVPLFTLREVEVQKCTEPANKFLRGPI